MADTKISALTAATTPLAGTEVLPIVQSGVTKKVAVADLTAGRAVSAASLTLTGTPLGVASGGTGLATLTANHIPYGNGTGALQSSSNLTFDGSHLLVGTTSNANNVTFKVYGSSEMASANATFQFWYSGAVQIGTFGQGNYALTGGSSTGMGIWSNTYLSFGAGSSNAEQLRLHGSGGLTLGNTVDPGAGGLGLYPNTATGIYIQKGSANSGSTYYYQDFYRGPSLQIGSITHNSSSGVTAYNTSSDQRLKENIVDAPSAIDIIDNIRIRSFTWKNNSYVVKHGLIAQELYEISPDSVTKGDDGETIKSTWQIDSSTLVPVLIKYVQELKAEFAQYKATHS